MASKKQVGKSNTRIQITIHPFALALLKISKGFSGRTLVAQAAYDLEHDLFSRKDEIMSLVPIGVKIYDAEEEAKLLGEWLIQPLPKNILLESGIESTPQVLTDIYNTLIEAGEPLTEEDTADNFARVRSILAFMEERNSPAKNATHVARLWLKQQSQGEE